MSLKKSFRCFSFEVNVRPSRTISTGTGTSSTSPFRPASSDNQSTQHIASATRKCKPTKRRNTLSQTRRAHKPRRLEPLKSGRILAGIDELIPLCVQKNIERFNILQQKIPKFTELRRLDCGWAPWCEHTMQAKKFTVLGACNKNL